ncbi:EAL domain-containing protein [Sulfoacidibacillus thermotolerans]|uniref:EAL domain-containing protein n=1 Tax=Sulfoacidibacillus thermotolerans TaxID=1765684 RepID=A0A2U3D8Y1_SULT2|nr:EAL domain-containing protein [Sulfoacidibacillus thermotolerans]PWI57736.1 hypothetical protein BM613_07045 [Sulfoacidibacillus thermotolerans]
MSILLPSQQPSSQIPLQLAEELEYIIATRSIAIHYQPIKNLQTHAILGWESLARGPLHSAFAQPLALFEVAERTGHLLELERICRSEALKRAILSPIDKLFLNISPYILSDPTFKAGETRILIELLGLRPEQIVFEITEHHAIKDYSAFLQLVNHYRNQGYQIAIDDMGAGYSGLVTLVQVKPDFVKIDRELICGIDKDQTKQDIVRAIDQICTRFNAKVIAEGIETDDELNCLKECKIEFGQGYLLGRPSSSQDA